ncbi:transcriptional regulator TAC1-like [Hordeum vulgare subsp. vulgare]|uniref:C2H2-type domain-containing protein n=1 Tax=Hordeum vulgare subsp. vulgare TaxID=112509 RepID=A0A8I6Y480_HORVV|nr:transcriptional regulator TAC1-like [Hordeum vulgare subsp. vulgare]
MESGSTAASSDETVRSPGGTTAAVAVAAARPYYECVFCKRGFTTAQALGGHMNIHRRDRAKPVRLKTDCNLANPPAPPAASPMSGSGFAMSYSGRHTGAGVDAEAVSPGSPIPRELSLFGADDDNHDRDDYLQLGLWCHGSSGGDGSERRPDGELPERKLDLELRLGPRPRH